MMSSETLHTDAEVAPDQGRDTTPEERLAAISREAIADFEDAGGVLEASEPVQEESAEGIEIEVDDDRLGDPEEVAEDQDADPEAEPEGHEEEIEADSEDEPEAQTALEWDGDPANVPDDLRPYFDQMSKQMNKGVNKRLQQIAEYEKRLKGLELQYQQTMLQQQQATQGSPASPAGPPTPPGEGSTQQDWQQYEAKSAEYWTKKAVDDLKASGQLPDGQQVAQMQDQMAMQNRLYLITNQEGASDDILMKMRDMAESDDRFLKMYDTDDGAIQFFNIAKAEVERQKLVDENEALKAKVAGKTKEKVQRKASAAGRATPRPGGTKAASPPEDVFASKQFRNVDDKLKYLNEEVLREAGTAR